MFLAQAQSLGLSREELVCGGGMTNSVTNWGMSRWGVVQLGEQEGLVVEEEEALV